MIWSMHNRRPLDCRAPRDQKVAGCRLDTRIDIDEEGQANECIDQRTCGMISDEVMDIRNIQEKRTYGRASFASASSLSCSLI